MTHRHAQRSTYGCYNWNIISSIEFGVWRNPCDRTQTLLSRAMILIKKAGDTRLSYLKSILRVSLLQTYTYLFPLKEKTELFCSPSILTLCNRPDLNQYHPSESNWVSAKITLHFPRKPWVLMTLYPQAF